MTPPPPGFELDSPAPPPGFEVDAPESKAPESKAPKPPPGFELDAPQPEIEDPVGHYLQNEQDPSETARAWEAWQTKENRPLNEKLSGAAGEFLKPENYKNAAIGAAKFGAGILGTVAHTAVGTLENFGARVSNAVGQDELAENLGKRAATNKAESVLGAQQAEESIGHTVSSIAGPIKREIVSTLNSDTGTTAERNAIASREKFDAAIEHARKAQKLQSGQPLDTGLVAKIAGLSEGENPSEAFSPERLQSMGAEPVNQFVADSIGAAVDPNNLIFAKAGNFPGAQKIAGGALKGVGGAGEAVSRTAADVIRNAAKSRLARHYASPYAVVHAAVNPAHILPTLGAAAAAGGTWAGAKLAQGAFGAMKEAGAEMLGAAPQAGQGFFRSVVKEGMKGATGTAVGMVPLNALESQGDPEEFVRSEINAGVFGGALGAAGGAKNHRTLAARGLYNQTVKSGEGVNFNDASDQAHQAVMQQLPKEAQDAINFTRGSFDGATTPDGKPIRVQAVDDATFQQQTGQSSRGVYFNDGTLLINAGTTLPNGTFSPKSAEAISQTLAHEGKHALDQAHQAAQPELYKTVFESLKNQFTTDGQNPTPEFLDWIQGQMQLHVDNLKQAGASPEEIQSKLAGKVGDTQYWLNEASADIGQGLITGQDLGAFMLPQSLTGRIWDALKDTASKNGINLPQSSNPGVLGLPEAAQAAREIRRQLYQAGAEARERQENPRQAPQSPVESPQPVSAPITPETPPSEPAPVLNRYRIAAILRRNGINAAEATHWANQAEGQSDEHAVIDALKKRAEAKFGTKPTSSLSPGPEVTPNTAQAAQKAPAPGAPISAETSRSPALSAVTAEATESVPGGAIAVQENPTSLKTKSTDEISPSPPTNQSVSTSETPRTPDLPSPNATPPGVRESDAGLPARITKALSDAETNTIQSPEYARKRATKTGTKEQSQTNMVKAARIAALYELLPAEKGESLRKVTDSDTGELTYEGTVDPQNPLHSAILRESGFSPAHIAVLESAQGRIGKGVILNDYKSAEQELGPAGETEQSAEQRGREYKASATSPEKGQRQGGSISQDKSVTILGVKGTKSGINLVTLDHDKLLDNTRKILTAAESLNPDHAIYKGDAKTQGKLIAKAFQDMAENNANGWKSRGDAPQKSFPDPPVRVTPGYKGKIVDRFLANVINMALHDRSGKPPVEPNGKTELAARKFGKRNAYAKEIAGLADINNRPLLPTGESNFLRDALERKGFETNKQIKPVISNIRPDLIEGGISDAPTHGRVVHEHGFDIPAGELTIKGRPGAKPTAGNFLPATKKTPQESAKERIAAREQKVNFTKNQVAFMPEGFYSTLRKIADEKIPNRASAKQILATLDPTKSGVKKEELEWIGLPQFLEGKETVSKKELLDFIDANSVELKEVEKGGDKTESLRQAIERGIRETDPDDLDPDEHPSWSSDAKDLIANGEDALRLLDNGDIDGASELVKTNSQIESDYGYDPAWGPARRVAEDDPGESDQPFGTTKFSQYSLPGGSNYKEVLLTLPRSASSRDQIKLTGDKFVIEGREDLGEFTTRERAAKYIDDLKIGSAFQSSHWDEPNVLAHIRQADHVDTEGSKVRLIEELQSDWHQRGRKEGYDNEAAFQKLLAKRNAAPDDSPERDAIQHELDEMQRTGTRGVPDAPFKRSWMELAFKNALRSAVTDNMDYIAWVPGEAQAARYDLSKQVDSVNYDPFNQRLIASKDGQRVMDENVPPEKLPDYIGKDVAQKLIDSPVNGAGNHQLKGEALSVGGSGMKKFYDQMLPDFVRKYVKKWGATVEQSSLRPSGGEETGEIVHSVKITPAMRKSVTEGQALFMPESKSPQELARERIAGRKGDLTKSEVGQSNENATIEKNLSDARMMQPDDPKSFLLRMAESARKQGKEEAALNFEAAAKVAGEEKKGSFLPEGKPYPLAEKGTWYSNEDFEKRGGKLKEMTPDEFLRKSRPLAMDETARDNIDDLKRHIQKGKKLDPLALYPNAKEDGRHRATAAKELGIQKVPVIVFGNRFMPDGNSPLHEKPSGGPDYKAGARARMQERERELAAH